MSAPVRSTARRPQPVDAIEQVVQQAARQGAHVAVVRDPHEWLRNHGEIAALLRW
ncbi:MAG: hypothetical protein ACLP4R_00910 [Solirubrobacteraceae bacterium]